MLRQKADGLEANMRKTQRSRENARERKVLGVGSRGLSMKSIGWTIRREEFTGKVISAVGRKPECQTQEQTAWGRRAPGGIRPVW